MFNKDCYAKGLQCKSYTIHCLEGCKFYATTKDVEISREKALIRISKLPEMQQQHIEDTYFVKKHEVETKREAR